MVFPARVTGEKWRLHKIIDWSNIRTMARTRDEAHYNRSREALLQVGMQLFINKSFNSVGLNEILATAGIPKGSFYHYFGSKEDFALQVVEFYAAQGLGDLEKALAAHDTSYLGLKAYFESSLQHFEQIDCCQGCLMANLSQELADVNENMRCRINDSLKVMTTRIAGALTGIDLKHLKLGHLSAAEAAEFLMNSWQGAVMKMKLTKDSAPLHLFMGYFFADGVVV